MDAHWALLCISLGIDVTPITADQVACPNCPFYRWKCICRYTCLCPELSQAICLWAIISFVSCIVIHHDCQLLSGDIVSRSKFPIRITIYNAVTPSPYYSTCIKLVILWHPKRLGYKKLQANSSRRYNTQANWPLDRFWLAPKYICHSSHDPSLIYIINSIIIPCTWCHIWKWSGGKIALRPIAPNPGFYMLVWC